MRSFSSTIRGMATAATLSAGALAVLPAAAYADANSTFVPCNSGASALITAITNANNGTGPRTINLAPGCSYFLTGTTGLPAIAGNVTLKAEDATIRRVSATPFRIVQINSGGHLTAEGITFAGGNSGAGINGGGFLVSSGGALHLSNSRVTQNTAGASGGGIANNGTVRLFNTVINSNNATVFGGGISNNGTLTAVGGIIGFNTSTNSGGGVATGTGGPVSFTSTDVVHNTTTSGIGGGVQIFAGDVTLRRSNVQFNTASANAGGGIANSGTLRVSESRLSNNRSTLTGGALINNAGTTTVRNSVLTENTASNGGAINEAGGTVTAVNSRITNNNPNNCIPAGNVGGCSG